MPHEWYLTVLGRVLADTPLLSAPGILSRNNIESLSFPQAQIHWGTTDISVLAAGLWFCSEYQVEGKWWLSELPRLLFLSQPQTVSLAAVGNSALWKFPLV